MTSKLRLFLLLSLAIGSSGSLGSTQTVQAAPALKPSATEKDRQLQQARLLALETQLQGAFERVKIGKDSIAIYLEIVEDIGRAKRNLAETLDGRISATVEVLRWLTVAENQIGQLVAAGIQSQEVAQKVRAARQRTAELLKSLSGDP